MNGERAAAAVFDLIGYDKLGEAKGALETALHKFPDHYSVKVAEALLLLKTEHYLDAKQRAEKLSAIKEATPTTDHRATEMLVMVLQQTCSWAALACTYERLRDTQNYRKMSENLIQTYARAGEYDKVQRLSMELYRKYSEAKYQVLMVQACLAQVPANEPNHMMVKLATKLLNTAVLTERGICNSSTTTMYVELLLDQGLYKDAVEFICDARGAKLGLRQTRLEMLARALLLENTKSSRNTANAVAKMCWSVQLDNWTSFALYMESLLEVAESESNTGETIQGINNNINTTNKMNNNINNINNNNNTTREEDHHNCNSYDDDDDVDKYNKQKDKHYNTTLLLNGQNETEKIIIDLSIADHTYDEALTFVHVIQERVLNVYSENLAKHNDLCVSGHVPTEHQMESDNSEQLANEMQKAVHSNEDREESSSSSSTSTAKKKEAHKIANMTHDNANNTNNSSCNINNSIHSNEKESDHIHSHSILPTLQLDVHQHECKKITRGPFLAELALLQKIANQSHKDAITQLDCAVLKYAQRFYDKPCCYLDLSTFLTVPSARAIYNWSHITNDKETSESSYTANEEVMIHMKQILGLRCYVASWWWLTTLEEENAHTSNDDHEREKITVTESEMESLVKYCVRQYNETKHLSTALAWSEEGLCDGYLHTAMVIVIHAALNNRGKSCVANDQSSEWYLRGLELLRGADRILNNPTFLLLSICFARQLGLIDLRALRQLAFRSVQHDTMSHIGYHSLFVGFAMEDLVTWNELASHYYHKVEQDCSLLRAKVFNYISWPAMKDVCEFENTQRHSVISFATRAMNYVTTLQQCQTYKSVIQFMSEFGLTIANDLRELECLYAANKLIDNTDWKVIYSVMLGNIHLPQLQRAMQLLVSTPTLHDWANQARRLLHSLLLIHDVVLLEQHRRTRKEVKSAKQTKTSNIKRKNNRNKREDVVTSNNANADNNNKHNSEHMPKAETLVSAVTPTPSSSSSSYCTLPFLLYYKQGQKEQHNSETFQVIPVASPLDSNDCNHTNESNINNSLCPTLSFWRKPLMEFIERAMQIEQDTTCHQTSCGNSNYDTVNCEESTLPFIEHINKLVEVNGKDKKEDDEKEDEKDEVKNSNSLLFEEFCFPELVLLTSLLRAGPKDVLPLQKWAQEIHHVLRIAEEYYNSGKWNGMIITPVKECYTIAHTLREEKLKRIKTYLHDYIIDIGAICRETLRTKERITSLTHELIRYLNVKQEQVNQF